MIQPLRAAHRRVFLGLAVVLPVILIAGLGARRPVRERTCELCNPSHPPKPHKIADAQNQYAWEPACEWMEPDVVIYWTPQQEVSNELPKDAQVLGAYGPARTFTLSPEQAHGLLLFYSVANHRTFASTRLEPQP